MADLDKKLVELSNTLRLKDEQIQRLQEDKTLFGKYSNSLGSAMVAIFDHT